MEGKDRPVAPQPPSSNAWWLGAAKKKAAEAGETVVGKAEPAVQTAKGAALLGQARAAEAVAAGKQALGLGSAGDAGAEGPPPQQHDEVDATPQEQAWRHDVEWEPHHHAAKPPSGPGPLQRAKDTAVHAAERLHIIHAHTAEPEGGSAAQRAASLAGRVGQPLRMAKLAEGRAGGADAGGGAAVEEEEEGPPPKHDEVDASPEEQFVRHSVRWPGQQHEGAGVGAGTGGAANSSHHPGAFQRLKETAAHAVHAVEGVAHRIEEKLPFAHTHPHPEPSPASAASPQQAQQAQAPPAPPPTLPSGTAEQRTGELLHMAKAREGRNQLQDDPVDNAVHAALRPDPQDKAVADVGGFPETLDEAIKVAQVASEGGGDPVRSNPTSGTGGAVDESGAGGEPQPGDTDNVNPVSPGARAKL